MKEKDSVSEERPLRGAESISYKPGKGAFVLLFGLSALLVGGLAFLFWYVPSVGLRSIHPLLPLIAAVIISAVAFFVIAGIFVVGLSLVSGSGAFASLWFRGLLVKLFLPLMVIVGGLVKIPRIKIERAFIDVNNEMVRRLVRNMAKSGRRLSPEKILLLMPHCIQHDDCKLKVTREVRNCAGCGKCEIGELLELAEKFDTELFVLTGGTVARRRLSEYSPDAVVAVACERDLASGVQDAYPLPVLAIVNKRPHGYCMQTGVAVSEIKDAIEELLGPGASSGTALAGPAA